MYRFIFPLMFIISYVGTRIFGLEPTILAFGTLGRKFKRWKLFRSKGSEQLREEIAQSYQALPIGIRCLDQAIITWYLLNLHGHDAQMRIGVKICPFMSHAWVEKGSEIWVDNIEIPDLQIVAQYPEW